MNVSTIGIVAEPIMRRAEVALRIVPVALAGGGPVTQTTQVDEWLALLSEQHAIPTRRIGVSVQQAGFVDEKITGALYRLDRAISPGVNTSDIYEHVCTTVEEEIQFLYESGIRHFMAVCCGYTSYGTFALQRAVGRMNKAHPQDPITGNVIVQDSSFPDTDSLSTKLDRLGYPVTRFHGPAYQSTTDLRIIFVLNGAVPFDVRQSKRCPAGCTPVMATLPYTSRYEECWRRVAGTRKAKARARLSAHHSGWMRVTASDWVVPLLASGGYWDHGSVGKWMTEDQYETMVQGTLAIAGALEYVAGHTGKRVIMPIQRAGADLLHRLTAVQALGQETGQGASLLLLACDVFPQRAYMDLILSADLVINRTVQANSFAETIFARRPQLVMTIPAAGYMDAELMAQSLTMGMVRYGQSSEEVGAHVLRILTKPTCRRSLIKAQTDMYTAMCSDPEMNFGDVLLRIAGVRSAEVALVRGGTLPLDRQER